MTIWTDPPLEKRKAVSKLYPYAVAYIVPASLQQGEHADIMRRADKESALKLCSDMIEAGNLAHAYDADGARIS